MTHFTIIPKDFQTSTFIFFIVVFITFQPTCSPAFLYSSFGNEQEKDQDISQNKS